MVVRQMALGRLFFGFLLGFAVGPVVLGAEPAQEAAPEQPSEETADSKDDDSKDDDSKDETPDPYALPEDADVEQLLAFIESVRTYQPKTMAERRAHYAKMMKAMQAAAEKIHEIATDQDKSLAGYDEAIDLLVYLRARDFSNSSDQEKQELIEEIKSALEEAEQPTNYLMSAAQSIAMGYEYGGEPDQAVKLYREFGGIVAKNPDPEIAQRGAKMEGAARRLSLVGHPLELHGTLLDGGTFDWGSYRGRIVLVDFWATWCGPCLREMPNVKKNYEAYHDKGFDVVAVSLDDDRARLDDFLEKNPKPWVNLHDGGWSDNDLATYYGIVGIPTVILVDQEGKVVSTRARGPELGRLLAELLGPLESEDGDNSEADADDASQSD